MSEPYGNRHVMRTADLRRAFDASFAVPVAVDEQHDRQCLIEIEISGEPYALPLEELSGVRPLDGLVPLRGGHSALLGITGIRGEAVAVFDLAVLLDRSSAEAASWLALVRDDAGALLGIAFAGTVGWLEAARDALATIDTQRGRHAHVARVLRAEPRTLPVLDVASIVAAISRHHARGTTRSEGATPPGGSQPCSPGP